MTAECRPPPGTPDKTLCWLRHADLGYLAWQWIGPHWYNGTAFPSSADAYRYGWRFHSIATPPEGEG